MTRRIALLIVMIALSLPLIGRASPAAAAQATPETSSPALPEAARGPEIPEKGYLVEEIFGGLYWLTDGLVQTMFLVTSDGVVAVDAPPSLGENYLAAIADVTDQPVTHAIYSHAHADHVGGRRSSRTTRRISPIPRRPRSSFAPMTRTDRRQRSLSPVATC